jgi:hypothetical protein
VERFRGTCGFKPIESLRVTVYQVAFLRGRGPVWPGRGNTTALSAPVQVARGEHPAAWRRALDWSSNVAMTEARGRAHRAAHEDTPERASHRPPSVPMWSRRRRGGPHPRRPGPRIFSDLWVCGHPGKGPPPPLALRTVVPAHGAERRPRPSRYGADLQEVNV